MAVYLKIRPSPMAPDSLGGLIEKEFLQMVVTLISLLRFRFVFLCVAETIAIDEREYMIYTTFSLT